VNRSSVSLLLLLAAAACSRTLYVAYQASSTSGPDDAYSCIQNKLRDLGYERIRYDLVDRRYVARRLDPKIQVSSGTFRFAFHTIETQVHADASGNSRLEITAHTYYEFELQRGRTDEEQSAADGARNDAVMLARSCSGQPPPWLPGAAPGDSTPRPAPPADSATKP
jgi:hypothetical protein